MPNTLTPILPKERIHILDSLRGIAVLGILMMNIPYFALPDPTQFNDLMVLNETGTVNETVWWFITVVFEGTQRALFCLLFGAGIILFTERQEQKAAGVLSADYFMRRQLWLMLFGMINFYVLLWIGDYLFPYAAFGMLLYTFRRMSPKVLIMAGVICMLLMIARQNVDLFRSKAVITNGETAAAVDTSFVKLDAEQKDAIIAMNAFKKRSEIEVRKHEAVTSVKKIQGNYNTLYKYQTERGFGFFTAIIFYVSWSHILFMFFGMAFYKIGIITGKASLKWYWLMFIVGMSVGIFLTWQRQDIMYQHAFNRYEYTKAMTVQLGELGRVLRSFGFFGLFMLMNKSGFFSWLFRLMRPVGQMAFTNYLTQSLLMGIYFYGIGFGMFGKLQRYEIYYVMAAVWLIQILWSHVWMHYFNYGPLEWVWRQLTYWKRLPLKKQHEITNILPA